LIILGNGADLNCGLKSSFVDFFSDYKVHYKNEFRDGCQSITDLKNRILSLFESGRLTGRVDYEELEKIDLSANYGDIENFWTYWLYLQKGTGEILWSDVESQIKEILVKHFAKLQRDGDLALQSNSRFLTACKSLLPDRSALQALCIAKIRSENMSSLSLYDLLIKDLKDFEIAFSNYLKQEAGSSKSYSVDMQRLIQHLVGGSKYTVLNFNYTNVTQTLKADSTESLLPIAEQHVHGEVANCNVIIGVDSLDIDSKDTNMLLFTKTYRSLFLSQQKYLYPEIILQPSIKRIVFFGHSLSGNDYSYFQAIFDHFDIYNSETIITFVYSVFQPYSADELAEEQYMRVIKLLQRYGETLDNESHGKNLLAKLLLEGRLMILPLSSLDIDKNTRAHKWAGTEAF
jgi:hypothetical protein